MPPGTRRFQLTTLMSQSLGRKKGEGAASWFPVEIGGRVFRPSLQARWKTNETGMQRLIAARRVAIQGETIRYVRYFDDFPAFPYTNFWEDTQTGSAMEKTYVVQTSTKVVERCLLMTTDPGDLVLDPTCGSGTTAYVAEQWGRRWITIDTSRVALALARTRLMTAKYPYYLLADSAEGVAKESEISKQLLSQQKTEGDIRKGFVYKRVPHVTLKSIANNPDIKEGMTREEIDAATPATPRPSCSTTSRTRTRGGCASLAPSPSSRSRRTASSLLTRSVRRASWMGNAPRRPRSSRP
jgi:adenine-specific DNA-methyltransferase